MSVLARGLEELGIEFTAGQLALWEAYIDLLVKWNKAYNLTAVRDRDGMVTRHLLDSLVIAPYVTSQRLLDIGAGAGLPSIPLAILWPHRQVFALDSNGKKVRFMQQVRQELALTNFTAIQTRVEQWQSAELFDGIVCRAFSSLSDMVRWSEHLLSPEGAYWAMKGRIDPDELSALPKPFKVSACLPLHVPGDPAERHLLVIKR